MAINIHSSAWRKIDKLIFNFAQFSLWDFRIKGLQIISKGFRVFLGGLIAKDENKIAIIFGSSSLLYIHNNNNLVDAIDLFSCQEPSLCTRIIKVSLFYFICLTVILLTVFTILQNDPKTSYVNTDNISSYCEEYGREAVDFYKILARRPDIARRAKAQPMQWS